MDDKFNIENNTSEQKSAIRSKIRLCSIVAGIAAISTGSPPINRTIDCENYAALSNCAGDLYPSEL